MQTPIRILRDDIEDIPGTRRDPSARDLDRQDLIRAAASRVLTLHGRLAITITSLAGALCLSPGAIKRVYPDMDALLIDILRRHLRGISNAIAAIERDDPDCFARRRAAYVAYTRTPMGNPTEAHRLLLRDRHTLPPEDLRSLEEFRYSLGDCLAPNQAGIALNLMDMPELMPSEIEACLASLNTLAAMPAAPTPEPSIRVPEQAEEPLPPNIWVTAEMLREPRRPFRKPPALLPEDDFPDPAAPDWPHDPPYDIPAGALAHAAPEARAGPL
jgi:AcrR family transcriptional regulator